MINTPEGTFRPSTDNAACKAFDALRVLLMELQDEMANLGNEVGGRFSVEELTGCQFLTEHMAKISKMLDWLSFYNKKV